MTPSVTIIVPCKNEVNYIDNLVKSILEQDYPKQNIEVLLIDGNSTDGTDISIQKISTQFPFIKYVSNPNETVPYAMNEGIKKSTGEIIIRLDAHAEYPSNYVTTLVSHLQSLNADNVGGVFETTAANNTSLAKAIAAVISHPFGVGNSHHRVGADTIIETDSVPYGCYKRNVFDRIGLYDEELTRNQDDELNGRLIQSGGKIYIIPFLKIKYYARDSIKKIWGMFFQYGLFKPLVNKKLGSPATIRQFIPLLFVWGIFVGGLLSFFSMYIFYFYLSIIGIYIIIGLIAGMKVAVKEKEILIMPLTPLLFATVHFAYGLGYLKGIKKILFNEKFSKTKINR